MTTAVRRTVLPALGGLTALALLVPTTGPAGADAADAVVRDRPVIVEVAGDAENGFQLTYDDGSSLYPPTDSEARAECAEYDTRVARVRCRVGVRTWYRDLGDLKRSIMFVQEHSGG